ncbi:MAG TPA: hypothetical protein VHE35_34270 [Kofleriaceae bacterium]|nr:hypothetical protein [Kofleriaceae bacterium]
MHRLALLAAILSLDACAVGGGLGYTTASISKVKNPRAGFAEDLEAHGATAYEEFRLIDTTGLLLAALVNSGRAYNARAEAIDRAKYDTPDDHGLVKVTYSYEPMPIISGLLTDLRLRIGLGAPTLELPPGMDSGREIHYWELDVRPEFYTFRPIKKLPMVSSLWLSATFGQWKADDADFISFSSDMVDMNVGMSSTYLVNENLAVTGRVGVGALSPLLGLISGGGLFNPQGEVEVGWRPLQRDSFGLMLSGNAYLGRAFSVDRNVIEPRIGINATFSIGDQRPRHLPPSDSEHAGGDDGGGGGGGGGAQAQAQAPAPNLDDPTAPISGNVCGGSTPAPECKSLGDRLTSDGQILLASCVLATQKAAASLAFDSQTQTCRTAADGLQHLAFRPDLSQEQRRWLHGAAAVAYDFAGAGYQIVAGGQRFSVDQCAMLEQTHNNLNPDDGTGVPMPSRTAIVDGPIGKCREQFACTLDGNRTITCNRVTASTAAPPAP